VTRKLTQVFGDMTPHCDGELYDDLWLVPDPELRKLLQARGLVWLTSWTDANGCNRSGSVIAGSIEQARDVVFGRALGETVTGPYQEDEPPPSRFLKGGRDGA
jgi:hypothetical protein